jgi:hypothetical protein
MTKTHLIHHGGPSLNTERVCYIIVKAREFDAKVPPTEPEPGSNPSDDLSWEILEDYADDPTLAELTEAIDGLNEDEQIQLVALAWVGRGDFDRREWKEAVDLARDRHNDRTAAYLIGMPNLGDCLEEGLAQFGRSCEDFEAGHL